MDTDPLIRQRVLADLGRGRTPHQIAGRLKQEATGTRVEPMGGSLPTGGARISHEALYTWIYALPKGELAMLPSKRGARRPRRKNGLSGARIVGMRSIRRRPAKAAGRRVPGHWEGDLVVGKEGESAVITLVDRQSRFTVILALPQGRAADHVADVLDELSETDGQGRPSMYGKIVADRAQALNDTGSTIPATGSTYWNSEAMNPKDYVDLESTPEAVATTTATVARNAAHLARLLQAQRYPAS